MANSIQAYASLAPTQRVYSGSAVAAGQKKGAAVSPVTPLSARTFGTWTAITSVVRLYAAYHIDVPVMYELALWTFGVAWAHFMSEWLVFKTTKMSSGLAGPVIVSTSSLIWMWLQWGYYVKV